MERRLYRSRSDRMIAGVCGGVAEYFEVDPTLVRLLTAVAAIVSFGAVALAYLVMAIVLPEEPEEGMVVPAPAGPPVPPAPAVPAPPAAPQDSASPTPAVWPMPTPTTDGYVPTPRPEPEGGRRQGNAGVVLGIILLLAGVALLAGQFVPGLDVWRLWPLILVAIGVSIIFRGGRR